MDLNERNAARRRGKASKKQRHRKGDVKGRWEDKNSKEYATGDAYKENAKSFVLVTGKWWKEKNGLDSIESAIILLQATLFKLNKISRCCQDHYFKIPQFQSSNCFSWGGDAESEGWTCLMKRREKKRKRGHGWAQHLAVLFWAQGGNHGWQIHMVRGGVVWLERRGGLTWCFFGRIAR